MIGFYKKTVLTALALLTALPAVLPDTAPARAAVSEIKVGYYTTDPRFEEGYTDSDRKNGYAYEYYQELARYTGWDYRYVYGSYEEIMALLKTGSIDMTAGISQKNADKSDAVTVTPYRMGTEYSNFNDIPGADGDDYYIAVSSSRTDIYNELCRAQEQMQKKDPMFCSRLTEKFYSSSDAKLEFTPEEKKWLDSHDTILVGYLDNYMPYSNKNADTGKVEGAMSQLFTEIYRILGKSVSAVRFTTYAELYSALESGEIDAMFPAYRDMWRLEREYTISTREFVNDEMKVIYLPDAPSDIYRKIAVLASSPVQAVYISDNKPDADIIHFNNVKSCLNALKKGFATSFIIEDNVLNYYLSSGATLDGFEIEELGTSVSYGFAAKKSNSVLCGLLDTALGKMNSEMIRDSINKNLYMKNNFTFIEFFTHNIARVLIVVLSVAAILVLVILGSRHKLKKKQSEIDKANEAMTASKQETSKYREKTEYDHLTKVFSRGHFMETASSKIAHHRPNDTLQLVMMDIDNFKSVNDTYGHDNGDVVLAKLGSILKEISRVNGFAGRFGGEEFMILMFGEDTGIQEHIISQVCKKLRETEFSFTDRRITLSVGVTEIKDGDTLEKCIERADKALYYSKKNGKNQINWYEQVIDKA